MEVLYLLVPLSVVLALIIAVVFVLAIRSGQFDDLEGPAYRVLSDDEEAEGRQASSANSKEQRRAP